jgi:hypothetical protein
MDTMDLAHPHTSIRTNDGGEEAPEPLSAGLMAPESRPFGLMRSSTEGILRNAPRPSDENGGVIRIGSDEARSSDERSKSSEDLRGDELFPPESPSHGMYFPEPAKSAPPVDSVRSPDSNDWTQPTTAFPFYASPGVPSPYNRLVCSRILELSSLP